jgi:uncharacterized repeat protein (TIGR03803 family)
MAITTQSAQTQTFTILHTFNGTDGGFPFAAMIRGTDGYLYGTTINGGNAGTVFKINPGGALTTVYSFCSRSNCSDGAYPAASVFEGTDGNFYGTTDATGSFGENLGTVFKLTPSGVLTTLHRFSNPKKGGAFPGAGVIEATDGNFYGTTESDGSASSGEVFKVTPKGEFTVLHSFCSVSGCADGQNPLAPLLQAADGDLYGTTEGGGTTGDGTVFKITTGGALTTLYNFCSLSNCADGVGPFGG